MKKSCSPVWIAGLLAIILAPSLLHSQVTSPDSLAKDLKKTQGEVDQLKKLRFSGYIQAQFQKADTAGIATFAGGNFEPAVNNRFMVRRGRLKASYGGMLTMAVLQIDITEKAVAVKDAYVHVTDPWVRWFGIRAGIFDRPFGFEISYSSSQRESPERARVTQSLFPGEREVGAKLAITAPEKSPAHFFQFDIGLFNGAGPQTVDFDSHKDVISHLSLWKDLAGDKLRISGGASLYWGGVRQSTKYLYNGIVALNDSVIGFTVDSTESNLDMIASRNYLGVDAQLTLRSKLGETTLRGEFIQGTQPGTSSSNMSPTKDPAAPTFIRQANGAYFYIVHTLARKHQLILKYDWYDPNTDIAGNQIGVAGSNTGKADIKFATTGIGYAFLPDKNLRFTVYYDVVRNEISSVDPVFHRDLPDNVVTLRVQVKFP